MPQAARLHDPIAHSQSLNGLIAGALIGGLIATVVVLTAPVAVPALIAGAAIAGAAVGGAGLGEMLGGLSFAQTIKGDIAQPGSPNVRINGKPAARAHLDTVDCSDHPARPVIAQGSASVSTNGMPAPRKGDRTACDAVIESGSVNVFIGGDTATTDAISPEVPDYVHTTMLLVGLASATILFGPAAAALGLAGGMLGGKAMYEVGGALFGQGSDGQKLLAFGGAMAGGWAGGKGGAWFDRNYQVQSVGLGANGGNLRITRRPQAPSPSPFQTRYDPANPGRPDPRWSVDTRTFDPRAPGAGRTATGEIRDSRQFWSEWSHRNPSTLSKANRYRIDELGLSPKVDKTWVSEFPEHSGFPGQTLEHHHYNQGPIAIPLPQDIHRGAGNYGIWHGP